MPLLFFVIILTMPGNVASLEVRTQTLASVPFKAN